MELTLYRGITVDPNQAKDVRNHILENGIGIDPLGHWKVENIDLKSRLEELFNKPNLTLDDTRPSVWINTQRGGRRESIGAFPAVCACGDFFGANHYAAKHHQNAATGKTHGLVITFKVPSELVQIDGKDFLYNPVFQSANSQAQLHLANKLFGSRLSRYLDRAMGSQDLEYRIALCDLAVQDEEVVKAHLKNEIIIGGRCGTIFKSAFSLKLPVPPSNIVSISDSEEIFGSPQVTLKRFLSLAE